ncbi:hypothetical protein HID58_051748, partial [Brassica napus]
HLVEVSLLHLSHDMSRMLDTPPKKIGHIRARSEILTLLDDLRFDSDLGVVGTNADGACFSDDTEEDLLSLYLDMDKFGSSAQVVEPLGTAWKVESLMHIQAQHLMDLVVYQGLAKGCLGLQGIGVVCNHFLVFIFVDLQEKAAFIFCVEDRALLCRDCDEATHAPNTRSANHQSLLFRLLYRLDEFFRYSDLECSNKQQEHLDLGEVDWLAEMGFFGDQPDQEALPAAEVPELSHVHSYNRPMTSNVSNKKPRFEISYDDEEDHFLVPDLGWM